MNDGIPTKESSFNNMKIEICDGIGSENRNY